MPLIFLVIIIVLLCRPASYEQRSVFIDLTADQLATLNHGGSVYGDYDRKIMISPPRR